MNHNDPFPHFPNFSNFSNFLILLSLFSQTLYCIDGR